METKLVEVKVKKEFDEKRAVFVVSYTEHYQHDNGKETWDSSSSEDFLFKDEIEADAKLAESDIKKSERENTIK